MGQLTRPITLSGPTKLTAKYGPKHIARWNMGFLLGGLNHHLLCTKKKTSTGKMLCFALLFCPHVFILLCSLLNCSWVEKKDGWKWNYHVTHRCRIPCAIMVDVRVILNLAPAISDMWTETQKKPLTFFLCKWSVRKEGKLWQTGPDRTEDCVVMISTVKHGTCSRR